MTTESNDTKPAKKPLLTLSGLGTLLTMIIAVTALVVSGRLFYNRYQDQEVIEILNAQIEKQQTQLIKSKTALAEQAETIAGLTKAVNNISSQFSEGKQIDVLKRYHLGDVQHAIQAANQSLLFEHDSVKATLLLEEANQNLSQLNDPALQEASAQISQDIDALKAVKMVDVNDIFEKLNTLITQTDTLSVTPVLKFTPDDNSEKTDSNTPALTQVLNWLSQYVRITKHTDAVTPLLTPEESAYVKHNMIVLLEQAQWGLLRREPLAYQTGLDRTEKLAEKYAVKNDNATTAFLDNIKQLKAIDIAPTLPDISKSLPLLEKVTSAPSGSESP